MKITKVFKCVLMALGLSVILAIVAHGALDLTSSNSALYILRGKRGGIEFSRDLLLEDTDRLIVMLSANEIFDWLMRGTAQAKKRPLLELTWDASEGKGQIKEFIPGGKIRVVSFSRFDTDMDKPHGLFMGGELPYGDSERSDNQDSSGFSYFDGKHWNHIWCTSNEAVVLRGDDETILPPHWRFLGSRVLKNTDSEVIIESSHEVKTAEGMLRMQRLIRYRAGDGYYILKVRLTNSAPQPIAYRYSWGDEPWVGRFGSSEGDIGWYEGGVIKTEQILLPTLYSYAGFWDYGNDLVGEAHNYTNYANFVEWHTTPSYVFFSNQADRCCAESEPLSSKENRIIGLVWDNYLLPGQSKEYMIAIGMADTGGGMPKKPVVRF